MTLTRLALFLPLAAALGCGAGSHPKATEPTPDLDFPVGPFSLTAPAKDGSTRTVTDTDLQGKVWVAAFAFTRCPGPCPRVSATMARLQKEIPDRPDLKFVTFTLDPAHDTPTVMRQYYTSNFGADPDRWLLLTGDEATIHRLSQERFKQSPGEKGGPGGNSVERLATHGTRLMVVDRKGVIRAVFDGKPNDQMPDGAERYEAGLKQLKDKVAKLLAE